jgi:hypothetical protein
VDIQQTNSGVAAVVSGEADIVFVNPHKLSAFVNREPLSSSIYMVFRIVLKHAEKRVLPGSYRLFLPYLR